MMRSSGRFEMLLHPILHLVSRSHEVDIGLAHQIDLGSDNSHQADEQTCC